MFLVFHSTGRLRRSGPRVAPSTTTIARDRSRIRLRLTFRKIVKSHAFRFVPVRNEPDAPSARAYVSCVRSSASAALRVMRSAVRYRLPNSASDSTSNVPRSSPPAATVGFLDRFPFWVGQSSTRQNALQGTPDWRSRLLI